MFDYLIGSITSKQGLTFTLENNQIGYKVYAPLFVWESLTEKQEFKIYLYQHLNETTNDLYGFLQKFDRDFFILLISTSGIGAKLALKILSAILPADLANIILQEAVANLKNVKGLGQKTAAKMILELKPKLEKMRLQNHSPVVNSPQTMPFRTELSEALLSLGYKNKELEGVLKNLYQNFTPTSLEEAIKLALTTENHKSI